MCGQSAARVMAWDLESVGKKKGGTAGGGCDLSMNMMLSAGELKECGNRLHDELLRCPPGQGPQVAGRKH